MADDAAGAAHCHTVGRDRSVHNAARANHAVFPDGHTGKQDRASADPHAVLDGDRLGISPKKGAALFRPVRHQPLLRQDGMTGGINLYIRGDQHPVSNADGAVIHKGAVDIDDDIAADPYIPAVVAVEGGVDFHPFAHLAEQFLQHRPSGRGIIVRQLVIPSRQLPGLRDLCGTVFVISVFPVQLYL